MRIDQLFNRVCQYNQQADIPKQRNSKFTFKLQKELGSGFKPVSRFIPDWEGFWVDLRII